MNKTIKHKQTN